MASLDELLHEVRRIEQHRVELTEKRIKSIYKSLAKDLNAFVAEEYVKYADKDGKLFLSYLDSKNKRAKFLSEIVKNVDGISPKVRQELLDLVDKTYEKSYKGIAKAVKEADDTKELLSGTKTLVRPEVLKQAVNNNIEKLTLNAVMDKHRAEIIADIQQTLNIGLMQGDRYETMAKRIQERLGVSYSKASNIARTESHRNIESGMMDGAKETAQIIAEDDNLVYTATWRTMKDERVRPQQRRKTKKGWKTSISKNGANHMKMDGVIIEVGEKFTLETSPELVQAECPGMSGTARNDCRCRCFLRYRLMTIEEFEKATGKPYDYAGRHYKKAKRKEPQITADLKDAVSGTGGELAGLDYRLKTESSYRRKVDKEMLELSLGEKDATKNMRDVVRYTSISKSETFVDDYLSIIHNLEEKGYSVQRVKNTFLPDAQYKGVNIILRTGDFDFELQFHTKQSFDLKNGILHELYEKERLVTTGEAERMEIIKKMKEISDSIVLPKNVNRIKSFNNLQK